MLSTLIELYNSTLTKLLLPQDGANSEVDYKKFFAVKNLCYLHKNLELKKLKFSY